MMFWGSWRRSNRRICMCSIPIVFLRHSLRELRGQVRADFITAAAWCLSPAASFCLRRPVGQSNAVCFLLRKHYCLSTAYMPCVTVHLATTCLSVLFWIFSSWEASHDSLLSSFLLFRMCFNYFSPTLPHYHLTLLAYQSFVVNMCGLGKYSTQYILITFISFLFLSIIFYY